VAKRDAPQFAKEMWHHDVPKGPKGRYRGSLMYHWSLFGFSQNKSAAKELMIHISQKE